MGPRAGLNRCGKSRPHRDSIPGPPSPYSVAIPTTLPGPRQRAKDRIKLPRLTGSHRSEGPVKSGCISDSVKHISFVNSYIAPAAVSIQGYGV